MFPKVRPVFIYFQSSKQEFKSPTGVALRMCSDSHSSSSIVSKRFPRSDFLVFRDSQKSHGAKSEY